MNFRKLAAIGVLAASFAPSRLRAQVSAFQVAVPFPFVVGTETLPAGTYVVQRYLGKPKRPDDTGVIVMKADNRHIYKVIVTGSSAEHHAAREAGSRLIFTSFNGKQYLSRVWVAGDGVAHQLASIPPEIATQGETEQVIVTGLQLSGKK